MIDLHCDTICKIWKSQGEKNLVENDMSIDSKKLQRGNVLGQCFALFTPLYKYVPDWSKDKTSWEIINEMHGVFLQEIEKAGIPQMRKVSDLDDGKLHAILTTEEGAAIEGDPAKLSVLRDWGVKIFGLTWNWENELAYPNSKDPEIMAKGLKNKGIEAVEECNRLGIIVDVSHLNDGGFWDVARYSEHPFIATHSNSRSVTNVTRNLTDEMLRAIADHGGVAGLNLCPSFLHDDCGVDEKESESRIEDMVRHVLYMYKTAGEDVLAIGSDFDGISGKLEIPSPDKFHLLRKALEKHGMKASVLDKMWYMNAKRVFLASEV